MKNDDDFWIFRLRGKKKRLIKSKSARGERVENEENCVLRGFEEF